MDENLYDEFGNYIGPDMPEIDDDNIFDEKEETNQNENGNMEDDIQIINKVYIIKLN